MSSGTVTPYVDFGGNANDTNENNAAAIQPVADGEGATAAVLTRPTENMRKRSEVIRGRQVDSLFLENADRTLLVAGPGKVTWPGSTTAGGSGIPTLSDVLWLLPALTPGFAQTQPTPPVASAFGVAHLQRVTGPINAILVTSQRRSYAAGDQINITVTPGGVYSCTLDTEDTGALRRTIKIIATGATTLGTVIASLNALTPPAPDNTPLVTAALEGGAANGDLILTTQARQFVVGNYDGEGHTVTPANLASFFSGNPGQVLAEGDTLCVAYSKLFDTASNGGRRQAIPENSNTSVPSGSFFNSRVHPELLYNALAVCKVINGSLVFGTGAEIAAGATNVGLSDATAPSVLRNGGFERAVTNSGGRYQIADWENRGGVTAATWRSGTTGPRTGARCLELNKGATTAAATRVEQGQEIPVVPAQVVRVSVWVKQLIAPTAGTYSIGLYWGDADSGTITTTLVALQVLSATDGAFRNVTSNIAVPAGKRFLKKVTVETTGVTTGSTGVALLVDDLVVTVEQKPETAAPVNDQHSQLQALQALRLNVPDALYTDDATLLRHVASTDDVTANVTAGDGGALALERPDQTYDATHLPPQLALLGRIIGLGAQLMGNAAQTRLPRITAPFDTTTKITLMWESTVLGSVDRRIRMYMGDIAHTALSEMGCIITVNAVYDGTNWVKDVNGQLATAFFISAGTMAMKVFSEPAATNSWAAWGTTGMSMLLDATGAFSLTNLVGGVNITTADVARYLSGNTADVTLPIHDINLGLTRRGNVMAIGTSDVASGDVCDPHGYFIHAGEYIYEEFDENSLGKFIRQDIVGTGTTNLAVDDSTVLVTTGASSGDHTILRTHQRNHWHSDGSRDLGFRARITISDVTSCDQRLGFWASDLGNPDVDANYTGFKIINGVISFVRTDNSGTTVTSTGITAVAGEIRWFSFYFDPVQGLIQWYVGANNGSFLNGYGSGGGQAYGTVAAADVNNSEDCYPFFGVKTTTASAGSARADLLSAWSNQRG
jgi:hypothetical protein